MHRGLVSLLAALALILTAFSGSASAARLYMPDYGSSTPEEIGGFELGPDGSIAPIAGSPFPAVVPSPTEPQGVWSLAFAPEGDRSVLTFFFKGGVQGYAVPPSGIFSISGSPVPIASAPSVSISPDGRFAFVSTREFGGMSQEGIHRFAIDSDGSLSLLPPSTPLPDDAYDLAMTPDGRFLFAQQGNQIARFAVGADGSLAPLGTTPAPGVFTLAASPDGRFLFAKVLGGIASFAIGLDGSLTKVGPTAPVGESGFGYFAVGPDGRHVYFPDRNAGRIDTVAIAPDGTPAVVGEGVPASEPESVAVSPDGRHLVFFHGDSSDNAIGVAAIGPDGVPTVLPGKALWNSGEPLRIVFQPRPAPVASFTVRPGEPGEATRFDAGGSTGAVRYDWDFGDGTTLPDGGPAPTHAYAGSGSYAVTLTVTDANGCSVRQFYNGQTTLCPGGSSPRTTATADTLPALRKLRAVPRKFMPKVNGLGGGKAKRGTSFRYVVSEAATVRFKFERKTIGRLVKGKCKQRTRGNSGKKKCPLFKKVGSRAQAGKAGANRMKFNGKLRGKPLPTGSYRATVVATDKAAGRSRPKTVGFRVLRLPEP